MKSIAICVFVLLFIRGNGQESKHEIRVNLGVVYNVPFGDRYKEPSNLPPPNNWFFDHFFHVPSVSFQAGVEYRVNDLLVVNNGLTLGVNYMGHNKAYEIDKDSLPYYYDTSFVLYKKIFTEQDFEIVTAYNYCYKGWSFSAGVKSIIMQRTKVNEWLTNGETWKGYWRGYEFKFFYGFNPTFRIMYQFNNKLYMPSIYIGADREGLNTRGHVITYWFFQFGLNIPVFKWGSLKKELLN